MNNDFFTIFIFPFKYEMEGEKELKPDEIAKILSKDNIDAKKGWAVEPYSLDSIENYNEFYYFHPTVQRAIFNKNGNEEMEFLKRKDLTKLEVKYYDEKNNIKKVVTNINEIDLHLFDNQIGLLTITTEKQENDDKTDFETFLRYNDIARRVYPPFLRDMKTCVAKLDAEEKGKIKSLKFINSLECENTCGSKFATGLLPVSLSLGNDYKENFKPIDLNANKEKDIVCLSDIITKLLTPFELKDKHDKKPHDKKPEDMEKDVVYYTPFIDDRMFIVSYYSDKILSDKLKDRCCDGYVYETSDDWYRFIFVDGNYANIANSSMKKGLIKKHTYARWANEGSFFGMSRYSFVLLCDNSVFSRNVLKQHMKSMYYQIALMALFQRAMLLKFTEDVAEITKKFKDDSLAEIQKNTNRLHKNFITFINKYWFIEVTPQEQGIEIYNQWMEMLNLEKLYNEVQSEIAALWEYVEMETEKKTNNQLAKITRIGFPLMLLSLILSILQVFFDKELGALSLEWRRAGTVIVVVFFSLWVATELGRHD